MTSLVAEHQLWSTGSELWCPGLVAPRHVGSSWTRDQTSVPALQGGFLTTRPRVMYAVLSCARLFCDVMDGGPPGSSVHGIL